MKKRERINKATALVSDRLFMKIFVTELHKYLKANMPQTETGERRWTCGYNHIDDSPRKLFRNFITFCKRWGVDWFFAHTIFRAKYGELYCDCDYLNNLKVTDDGVEVIEEQSFD